MDIKLQTIVQNDAFESTTRFDAASVDYPRILPTSRKKLLLSQPPKPTPILSLRGMPSKSECEHMKRLCGKEYAAVSCECGTFTPMSLELMLKIHDLREIKTNVRKVQKWLEREIDVPKAKCRFSQSNINTYANKILQTPNNHCVLENNRSILASDLATIAGNGWLSLSIINGIAEIINNTSATTAAFMLNNIAMIDESSLPEYVKVHVSDSTKYLLLFSNVGRYKSGEVFVSTPGKPGCHWTLLFVDLVKNKWFYCDTSCWAMPTNLKAIVNPFVTAIYQDVLIKYTKTRSPSMIAQAHVGGRVGHHICQKKCYKNIPIQTCDNVCGVGVIIMGGIASAAPELWGDVFFKRDANLPRHLMWILNISDNSDFLRHTVISWLLEGFINVSLIGIDQKKSPTVSKRLQSVTLRPSHAINIELSSDEELVDEDKLKQPSKGTSGVLSSSYTESATRTRNEGDSRNKSHTKTKQESPIKGNCAYNQHHYDNNNSNNATKEYNGPCNTETKQESPTKGDCARNQHHYENGSDNTTEEGNGPRDKSHSEAKQESSTKGDCARHQHHYENGSDNTTEEGNGPRDKSHSEAKQESPTKGDCARHQHHYENGSGDTAEEGNGPRDKSHTEVKQESSTKEDCARNQHHYENGLDNTTEEGNGPRDKSHTETKQESPTEGDGAHNQHHYENGSDNTTNEGDEPHHKSHNETKQEKSKIFYEGQIIHNLAELENLKGQYEQQNFCELVKSEVRTLKGAKRLAPNRVDMAKPSLKYYSLKLACKFGGKARQRQERKRNTKTFRQECPFVVHLTLSVDGQHLRVRRINEDHNHVLRKEIYEHLPRQRASKVKSNVEDIEAALKLKANAKLLQQKVEKTTGQRITLKDIANIKQKVRKEVDRNNIEQVVDYLNKQSGSTTEVIVDEDNNFKGIFYQDNYMQNLFEKFPEMILVDATYKLLDLRMPVYILTCIDGDGLGEIVAVFILAEESKLVVEQTVEVFKKHNNAWSSTRVVMSDKDFVERDAFTNCFPDAKLNICIYHTLRTFNREISCQKLGITSGERLHALEILSRMANAKSPSQYTQALDQLKNTNMKSVIDYFLQNWDPIKEQWVACFKDKTFNLGETTNNRLESTFSKLKNVCSRYASLMQFFSEFFSVLNCLRDERKHHYVMAITRKNTELQKLNADMQQYANYLTPYAFEFVNEQFLLSNSVNVIGQKSSHEFHLSAAKQVQEPHTVSTSICDCSFFTRMSLPCKHIFKLRSTLDEPLFCESLVNKRWSMAYYYSVQRFPQIPKFSDVEFEHSACPGEGEKTQLKVSVLQEQKSDKAKVLSQSQKFRKGLQLAQYIASLISEGGMTTFRERYEVLQSIVSSWQQGREIIVWEKEGNPKIEVNNQIQADHLNKHDNPNPTKKEDENSQQRNIPKRPMDDAYNLDKDEKSKRHKEVASVSNQQQDDDVQDFESLPSLASIKIPPKISKRGRPKGAEITVIGLPKTKKRRIERSEKIKPFSKLPPEEKENYILRCLTSNLAATKALAGERLLNTKDLKNVHEIPDSIQDKECFDIYRVQTYFKKEAWYAVLSVLEKKENIGWTCGVCSKIIDDSSENSIGCDRCLLWFHFQCSDTKKKPKNRNWFCKSCKLKLN